MEICKKTKRPAKLQKQTNYTNSTNLIYVKCHSALCKIATQLSVGFLYYTLRYPRRPKSPHFGIGHHESKAGLFVLFVLLADGDEFLGAIKILSDICQDLLTKAYKRLAGASCRYVHTTHVGVR